VSRFSSVYVRIVLMLAILAALGLVLGSEPWGPR
jgi:hypothetical protein